jgi:hypothetical protein
MTDNLRRPEFRPLQKEANSEAVKMLRDLLGEAERGEVLGLAVVVRRPDGVQPMATSMDEALQMLAAVDRLHHKMHLWLDEEYPD